MITIPTEGQDGFMQLLVMRMQALWAHRQSVALEGVSVDLPLRKSEQWTVRVGDLKSTGTGLTRAAGGPGAGGARAVLVEIQYSQNIAAEDQTTDEPTLEVYEDILRGLLKKLFKDVNDFNFEDAKGLVRKTDGNRSPDDNGKPHGWRLASLYMDVLRGTRGQETRVPQFITRSEVHRAEANNGIEGGPETNPEPLVGGPSELELNYELASSSIDKKQRRIRKPASLKKKQDTLIAAQRDAVKHEFEEATQREIKKEREDMRTFGFVKTERNKQ